MSHIVFFCIPAHGHTNPTLGVVRELVARGHRVTYYSYEPFREQIRASGAEFVSCEEFDAETRLTREEGSRIGSDLALSTRVLVDTTLSLEASIRERMESDRPDCIVADSMAVWGKAVAQKMGIPYVCSTTTFAFNQYSARIMKRGLGELWGMIRSMGEVNRQIKRLQERGFPVNSMLDIFASDEKNHTIVYTSPQFQPCAGTFGDKFAFVGPSIRSPREPVEKIKDKLVYISMGTVNNAMLPLYRSCVEALAEMDCQGILSIGDQVPPEALGELPEHVQVFTSVDQIAVLEQADVFLTHCGMNSASEGLYYGVPLAMLPKTSEQGAVATRTEQLGAGLRVKKETPAGIRQVLETLLTQPQYRERAAQIGRGFRACSGAKGAADKIENVIGGC